MGRIRTLAIVFCCAVCIANSFAQSKSTDKEPNQPAYVKPILPDKLKADLDFLFKTIEEVHPNMYAYTSKEEFDPLREQLYRSINRPMNRPEFYKLTAPVVALLKNGHTFLQLPFELFQDYALKGGKYFPLEIEIDKSTVTLTKYHGPYDLPLGVEVIAINNKDSSEFLHEAARYTCLLKAKLDRSALLQRKSFFPIYLWLEKPNAESLSLQIKATNGQIENYTIKALDYQELLNYQKSKAQKTKSDSEPNNTWYYYRYLPDHNTGLIEFNTFHDLPKFKKFLKQTFTKIRDQNVSNLIIDIRKNPGGDSRLGKELLKYLTDKPFTQFEEVQIKISEQLCKQQPGTRKMFPDAKIGSTISMNLPYIKPEYTPLRFKGKVFVLIGPKSASSSVAFASTVKHFKIGSLIGEETIDTTVCYGDCISDKLPNTGLSFSVACKRFVDAGGKEDSHGVIPEYEVKQKRQDTAKGVDTVLEFTLNLIKSGETKI